jgi:hypothetical protein
MSYIAKSMARNEFDMGADREEMENEWKDRQNASWTRGLHARLEAKRQLTLNFEE